MRNILFKGILLVCDMDGTLLNSRSEVSEENRAALKYFVDNGGLFTIATGRMECSVEKYISALPINAPTILYNGAMIYCFTNKEALWRKYLHHEVETIVKDLIKTFPGMGVEVFHGGNIYFLQQNQETEKHRIKEGFLPHIVSIEQVPKPWYKVLLAWEPEKLVGVENFLMKRKALCRAVYSEPQFLEILDREVSKGQALRKLSQLLELEDCNTVAVGDNLNDLEMIKMAGMGFAVENAHPKLKFQATCCCCHHDRNAIAEVIRYIEQIRRKNV